MPVFYRKSIDRWVATIDIDRRKKHVKQCRTREEAEEALKVAEAARKADLAAFLSNMKAEERRRTLAELPLHERLALQQERERVSLEVTKKRLDEEWQKVLDESDG